LRKGAQQAAAIVAASRTGRCLRTTVVLEQDGRAPANFESQHRSTNPRPTLSLTGLGRAPRRFAARRPALPGG